MSVDHDIVDRGPCFLPNLDAVPRNTSIKNPWTEIERWFLLGNIQQQVFSLEVGHRDQVVADIKHADCNDGTRQYSRPQHAVKG